MKRLRPAELAQRLMEALRNSPDARERLLARVLSLEIPRLSVRGRKVLNRGDYDLCYWVLAGVKEKQYKSEWAACLDLAERGVLTGAGTLKSRAARLQKAVEENREIILAQDPNFHALRTGYRIVAAQLSGTKLSTRDPELEISMEQGEVENLISDLDHSIKIDQQNASTAFNETRKIVLKFIKSRR